MGLEQLNALISEKTGVPASLLDGKTAEENIAKARALIEYHRKNAKQPENLSAKEKFADWLEEAYGDGKKEDPAITALDNLAEELRIANGGYPIVADSGEVDPTLLPDTRPASVQFAEWFREQSINQFNPRKDSEGWIHLG